MQFIVLMTQNGGCDYTIGCGLNWEFVKADSKEEALKRVFGDPDKIDEEAIKDPSYWKENNCVVHGLNQEGYPDSVTILELGPIEIDSDECESFYGSVKDKFKQIRDKQEAIRKEKAEKDQYEKLKRKFEK